MAVAFNRGAQVSEGERETLAAWPPDVIEWFGFALPLRVAELSNRTPMVPKGALSDHTRKFVVISPMML